MDRSRSNLVDRFYSGQLSRHRVDIAGCHYTLLNMPEYADALIHRYVDGVEDI